jgi:large conductance mechanosensitive channel
MLKEFKEFALKGSLLDLAIGVIIGGAFGKIIASLVTDIIMPPIGLLLGGIDFSTLYISLNGTAYPTLKAAQDASAPVWTYGIFLNNVINFLIIALVLFLVIRAINRMKKPAAVVVKEPDSKTCPYCFTEIPIRATRCPNCTSELKG